MMMKDFDYEGYSRWVRNAITKAQVWYGSLASDAFGSDQRSEYWHGVANSLNGMETDVIQFKHFFEESKDIWVSVDFDDFAVRLELSFYMVNELNMVELERIGAERGFEHISETNISVFVKEYE